MAGRSVLQDWVCGLSFMQQSVLITGCRGPDTLHKDHIAKVLCRWLRRCFLISAFDGRTLHTAYTPGGGSFTGPCNYPSVSAPDIDEALNEYLRCVDEVPHHFHLHLMHSAEILGFKHPEPVTRSWWLKAYHRMCNDMHLLSESESQMDRRLGDNEGQWRAAEEVTAK